MMEVENKTITPQQVLANAMAANPTGVVVLRVTYPPGQGIRVDMEFSNIPTIDLTFVLKSFDMQVMKFIDRGNTMPPLAEVKQ